MNDEQLTQLNKAVAIICTLTCDLGFPEPLMQASKALMKIREDAKPLAAQKQATATK